jgi:hypothetical protein
MSEVASPTAYQLKVVLLGANPMIRRRAPRIPNYAERYRYAEAISTAFAESTINPVVSKRMVTKQQMRWRQKGAHRLLQVRPRILNGELRDEFRNWMQALSQSPAGKTVAIEGCHP